MSHEEIRRQRHSRIRRAKALLRYMPRRAVFHRYPVIGRFAQMARKRPYLWSMKPRNLTPAFYLGSILAVMPITGLHLPIAFACALLFRTNLMIIVGLQFITNPATIAPIYAGTYYVGRTIIEKAGLTPAVNMEAEVVSSLAAGDGKKISKPQEGSTRTWTSRVVSALNALVVGGLVCGTVIGAILDITYRLTRQHGKLRVARDPPAPPDTSGGSTGGEPFPK